MNRFNRFWRISLCLVVISGCNDQTISNLEKADKIDPSGDLSRQDYRDFYNLKKSDQSQVSATAPNVLDPQIPDFAEILAAPQPPKIGATQLVSVAVTDDVPLKDVLIELARLADVDMELDSGITGGITFRAKDRPFNEVIDRICDLAGLRYTMKDGVLRIERDTPYIQIYSLDFLNLQRDSNSSFNVNTSILSSAASAAGGGGGGSGGLNSGSTADIKSKSDSDFWKQFDDSIKKILDYHPVTRLSGVSIAVQPALPAAPEGNSANPAASSGRVAAPAPPPPPPPPPAPVEAKDDKNTFYNINHQAGTLTVSGNQRQQEIIQRFLKKIQEDSSSQVLIEAKIVEINLNDQFQSGVDWSKLGNSKLGLPFNFQGTGTNGASPFNSADSGVLTLMQNNLTGEKIDLDLAVQLAQTFGTTRTLSSPRLHAINNQQALLSFAINQVYFTLQVTPATTTTSGSVGVVANQPTVTSTPHTVPIGIIMALQPSINTETNEVTLSVRPSLSKIVGEVSDPQVTFAIAQALSSGVPTASEVATLTGLTSQIPIVQVRELDSIVKLKSGQVMVIGGFMSDESDDTEQGLPGVSGIPWIGNLFRANNKAHTLTELVIFIRATIVPTSGSADKADQTVYHKYTQDPRPLPF